MNWCERGRAPSKRSSSALILIWAAFQFGLSSAAHASPITALTFSPDGKFLISNEDRQVAVRSPTNASLLRRIPCEMAKICSLSFKPDGRLLAVGGGDPGVQGEVRILTWPEAKELQRLTNHADLVTQVTFDPDGTHCAVASADGLAHVWRLDEGLLTTCQLTLRGHVGPVLAIAFSPSKGSILTAGADRSLKLWSRTDGRLLRSFNHHTEAVHALAFRPRGADKTAPDTCISGGDDRTVRVWQPEIGRMVRIIRQHEGSVLSLAWSANGASLYSAGREGIIRQIEGDSDTIAAEWPSHQDWIYALSLSPDGSLLASGDWAGTVRVRRVRQP